MILKRFFFLLLITLCIALVIVISFWMNLNSNKLTPWLENELNSTLPKPFVIRIARAETRLTGLFLDRIELAETDISQTLFTIDSAIIDINPLDLLIFQRISYHAELYEGTINGELDVFPDKSLTTTIREIQVNRNPFLRKTHLIVSNPLLNGDGTFQFSDIPRGQLTLSLDQLNISGKSDHTGLPFEFPTTGFERINCGLILDNPALEVRISSSGDLSANLEGKMGLNWKALHRSTLDLELKGKLDSKYESGLGFFKDILVNYKNTAGQISVKITGSLNRPKVGRH